ncbi:hypothetical protein V8F20_012823 [Naviculisporaceae sp. PSN 640]
MPREAFKALDSLPAPCKQACDLAIDYAKPFSEPCIPGSFFQTYLDSCLAPACRNKAEDPNKVSTYVLAQVYDQLKACGPETWAWQWLNRIAPGNLAVPTTYTVTSWESASVTLTNGKETISSSAVLTSEVTEKYWVVEAWTGPTTSVEVTITPSDISSIEPPAPVGRQGPSQSDDDGAFSGNSYTGIIAGAVIGGVALWALSIFAAVWVYKRRKRRGDRPRDVDGENLDNDLEKPKTVEMYTEREKAELGDGDIYEIGTHEAFELDATQTELQKRAGPSSSMDDMKKERPTSKSSSNNHKGSTGAVDNETMTKDSAETEPKVLGTGTDTRNMGG